MMVPRERISTGDWVPPWLRFQHEERYRFAAAATDGRTVLDLACGIGYGSAMLRDSGASAVVGADLSIDAVQQAMMVHRRAGISFLDTSALALPFADKTFDVMVSLETIEHVENDGAYVREARRVLRDGGVLICSTPNRNVLNPGRRLSDRPFNQYHVREYTVPELEPLLRPHFRSIEWFGQSAYGRRYLSLLGTIGRRLPMVAVRLHQVRKLLGMPFERRSRHTPRPLPMRDAEPEVLLAVCRS